MPFTTIQDPKMAQGFSILAQALAPNAEREINADMARKRADYTVAQTELERQKHARTQGYMDNQSKLQELLAANPDLADPANRATLMSILAGTETGMQHGPKFATGATTFINPQTFEPSDFSNVLLGTGVVNDYGQTPTGSEADNAAALARQQAADAGAMARTEASLANTLTQTQMNNDAAMQRHITPGGTPGGRGAPLDVDPNDLGKLQGLVQSRLEAMFPEVDPDNMDPSVAQALMPRVAQLYQQTRNAELAIQQALSEIPMEQYGKDESWWPTGDTQRLRPGQRPAAPSGAAENPGAAAAPAAAPGAFQEGQTATGPGGQKIIYRGGQWVPIS